MRPCKMDGMRVKPCKKYWENFVFPLRKMSLYDQLLYSHSQTIYFAYDIKRPYTSITLED